MYGRLNNHLKSLTNLLAVAEFHGLNLCIPQQLHHELSRLNLDHLNLCHAKKVDILVNAKDAYYKTHQLFKNISSLKADLMYQKYSCIRNQI